MGETHEFLGDQHVSPNQVRQSAPQPERGPGGFALQRQMVFWLAALALFILFLWLLADILLPFIAGLAIAYFLAPLVDRLERMGVNRLVAALAVISLVVLLIVLVLLLILPLLGSQLGSLIDNIPTYVTKLRSLVSNTDAARAGAAVS